MPPPPICRVSVLGKIEYRQAWDFQVKLADAIRLGQEPNTLLLLEHPHVYTIGRRGAREQVLLGDNALNELGIDLQYSDRGGQVTYHGPGQLVAYPVVDLKDWGGPLKYVRALEQVMVKTMAELNIKAGVVEGITGVWVNNELGGEKIGAIGVKISRGIAYHGLSLNVSTDLSYFGHIIPCGMADARVTSVERLLGTPVEMDLVAYGLSYHFGREMGFRMVEGQPLPAELLQHNAASSV